MTVDQKNQHRLILALYASLACICLNLAWYKLSAPKRNASLRGDPIAKLITTTNETLRKPSTRLIWESVLENELLYPGESVRTGATTQAKIEFIKTGTIVEMEPESVILLEESQGKLALDFLKGNLFVKSEGVDKDALTLKAAGNQINVKDSDLRLAKEKTGDLNLQVMRGSANVDSHGKFLTLDTSKSGVLTKDGVKTVEQIKIAKVSNNDSLFVDTKKDNSTTFQFEPMGKDYVVQIEIGTNSNNLALDKVAKASGDSGKINVAMNKGGNVYWRLVATSAKKTDPIIRSPIVKSRIIAKSPMILLEPSNDSQLTLSDETKDIRFRWANPINLKNPKIEVATSSDFKILLAEKTIGDGNSASLKIPLNQTYYWRMVGYLGENKEPIVSEPALFKAFTKKYIEETTLLPAPVFSKSTPPELIAKADGSAHIEWQSIQGAKHYQILIKDESGNTISEQNVKSSKFFIEKLLPGKYNYNVIAVDARGKAGEAGAERSIRVPDISSIQAPKLKKLKVK